MQIPEYSQIVSPLYLVTRKKNDFHWGPKQQQAFAQIKQEIAHAVALSPVRTRPEVKNVLYSAAGNNGLSWSLWQKSSSQFGHGVSHDSGMVCIKTAFFSQGSTQASLLHEEEVQSSPVLQDDFRKRGDRSFQRGDGFFNSQPTFLTGMELPTYQSLTRLDELSTDISHLLCYGYTAKAFASACDLTQGVKPTDTQSEAEATDDTQSEAEPTDTKSEAQPAATRSEAQPTATTSGAQPTATTSGARPTATRSGDTIESSSLKDLCGLRRDYTRRPDKSIISWIVRLWDAAGEATILDGTEARHPGSLSHDPVIDQEMMREASPCSLWERVLGSVAQRYLCADDLYMQQTQWKTIEQGIQRLREMAVAEIVFSDDLNTRNPNLVPCTPVM
ncbi:hypothetical protein DUI87_01733 [Hirundo rustica rustica]|uniref:Reverse transcriptase/retrotransposon-derived protein RNase H-like domain-containing protein n=1 Tax=Hirundo rustica rustica TaxID=333673 RepID=A0A3M0LCV2_HIRRU|nr:hypothetical protein DUI87_01733 [Hirundo rustica rustica]